MVRTELFLCGRKRDTHGAGNFFHGIAESSYSMKHARHEPDFAGGVELPCRRAGKGGGSEVTFKVILVSSVFPGVCG